MTVIKQSEKDLSKYRDGAPQHQIVALIDIQRSNCKLVTTIDRNIAGRANPAVKVVVGADRNVRMRGHGSSWPRFMVT